MDRLVPALFVALIGSLILVFTYLNLYLQERQRYLALWLASFTLYVVRSVLEILVVLWGNPGILATMNHLSVIWSAAFLLWGTCLFSGKKLSGRWLALFAAGSLWVIFGISFRLPPLWTTLPAFLLSAFAYISTGAALLWSGEASGPAKLTTGWAFILWGLHKADYPLLRPLSWGAPLGYVLSSIFSFISALGIILMYLEKTKKELKASEEKYRSIFENAAEGVFQVTPEGRFLQVNPALVRMYGYGSPEDLIGSVLDLTTQLYVDPGDREKVRARLKEQGLVEKFETRMYRKDGEIRWVSMNVRAVNDDAGETRFFEGSFEDITDRMRAEEDLRTSRLHLSDAADLARIAYWEHDEASDEFIFNEPFYALYATSAGREGGFRMARNEYIARFVYPDDAAALRLAMEENRAHPHADYLEQTEHRAIRRDGKVIHILTRNRAVTDQQGRLVKTVGVNQDITERKKTEEQLTVANFAMESSISAIELASMNGEIIFVNKSWLRHWGYDRAEEVFGRPVREFAAAGKESEAIQAFRSGSGYVGEGVALRKDGTTFDVQFTENLVRTPDGKPVCMMASFIDISDRKRAEARLKESEERYRFLFDSISDAIFVHSLTEEGLPDHFIEVNGAACALLGWDREELIRMTPRDISSPEGLESVQPMMKRLQAEKRTVREGAHVSKDGRRIPVEVSLHLFDFRGRPTVLAAVRDITERKAAEEALQNTAARLKRAARVSGTGNWELNLSTGTMHASPGASKIYGLEDSEFPLAVVQQSPLPEYRDMLDKALRALIRGNAPYDVEFKIRRAESGDVVDIHSVAEYDPERKTVFGVIQDVTDKKRLESQLRQAQKMEAIGTLAGGVAHDFNNILTVIMGLGNLIQMSLDPDDRNRPYIDQIVLSSERAADLTQSLLAYSRKQRTVLESHHVGNVVSSTAKLLKRLLPEDITLKLDLADENAVALLDVSQIDQVLMNLATNARDAMPGGGSLTIRTEKATLDGTFRKAHGFGRPGAYVHLSVSDTGVGMDEATMARIFDPFFTTKEVGKGTGLGLASAFGIVKQHNGYITVASRLSEGTTFDIYLPLADVTGRPRAPGGAEVKGGSETILVLEDDADVRRMITKILSGQGYATLEASNGDDAIRVYDEHRDRIGLVIMDVVMPGKNGKEVFDEIARIDPRIKAIFMSGYTGDIVIDKGVQKDKVDFLQKPLSIPQLLATVRQVLDR